MNSVLISGRLGKDPEVRHTPSGKTVASFSIANDEGYGDKRKTTWFQVVAWEKLAEFVERNLTKGRLVLIQGSVGVREYETESGKRMAVEINASKIEPLEAKGEKKSNDDDIPF